MKSRKEAADLVRKQLLGPNTSDGHSKAKTPLDGRMKAGQWHYGKQELRELLDFIYGGPPESDEERVA